MNKPWEKSRAVFDNRFQFQNNIRRSHWRCSLKKVFLKSSQISQKNTSAGVSLFLMGFIKTTEHRSTDHRPTDHLPLTHRLTDRLLLTYIEIEDQTAKIYLLYSLIWFYIIRSFDFRNFICLHRNYEVIESMKSVTQCSKLNEKLMRT